MRLLNILRNGTDSFKELFALYVGVLVIGAASYATFEGADIFSSLWWAVVTALTIGYGDMYPHSIGGRIVGVLLMHATVFFIIPLIVARFANNMIANTNEFTHQEQEEIKKTLKNIEKRLGK